MITLFGKPEPVEPSLLDKLKASVSKTKAALSETVDTIFQGQRKIDPALLKQLETALLSADLGVATTKEILESVKEKLDRSALSDGAQLKRENVFARVAGGVHQRVIAPIRPQVRPARIPPHQLQTQYPRRVKHRIVEVGRPQPDVSYVVQ